MVVNAFMQSLHALLIKFGINAPDIRVHGLTLDSREVTPKLAFVAVKGHSRDGRDDRRHDLASIRVSTKK